MESKVKRYDITRVQPKQQETPANFKQHTAQHASDEKVTDGLPPKLKRTLPSREHLFGDVITDKNKKYLVWTLYVQAGKYKTEMQVK